MSLPKFLLKMKPSKGIKSVNASTTVSVFLTLIAACMLGPCAYHIYDIDYLAARVADLRAPLFADYPLPWAYVEAATETVGSILIASRYAPKFGSLILLPKMAV